MAELKTREMRLSDMDGLMKLKNDEGWNQTEKDWELLILYPDSVNLVAVLDEQIVGSVCAINYDHTVAWIGMMLIDKEFRGRGISKILLSETIHKLEKCASIKLDATPAGRPVYKKFSFKDEYTLYRMTHPSVSNIPPTEASVEARQVRPEDLSELVQFDKLVFGADRTSLIAHLYKHYPELAWIIRENDNIAGYCLGREGVKFTQIGPVYGTSEEIAKSLIQSAISNIPGKAVVVDIPAAKSSFKQWLESYGFVSQRPFERMYLSDNPHPGIIKNQYLICGPELG